MIFGKLTVGNFAFCNLTFGKKCSTNRTPAFIQNKWADPLGTGGADPIRVKQKYQQFYVKTENWRERMRTKESAGNYNGIQNMIK
jgi:hypothetical protein